DRRGDRDLLLVAAGEGADAGVDPGRLHLEARAQVLADRPHPPAPQPEHAAGDLVVEPDHEVLAHGQVREEARRAVGRDETDVLAELRRADLAPPDADLSLDAPQAARRAHDLAPARALDADEGRDRPLAQREVEAREGASAVGEADE